MFKFFKEAYVGLEKDDMLIFYHDMHNLNAVGYKERETVCMVGRGEDVCMHIHTHAASETSK